jgi:hypothetical protein
LNASFRVPSTLRELSRLHTLKGLFENRSRLLRSKINTHGPAISRSQILKLHILLSESIDRSIGIGNSITIHIVTVPATSRQH